jgi:glycosyltransferase involved in cell wall biosynthesis
MRVLVLTNMYPKSDEPWFGVFVKDQVEDLRLLGCDVDVLPFDGRRDRSAYLRVAATLRRRLRSTSVDLVHAHYGLTGAVAASQRRVPVVTTFHGSDICYIRWQRAVSRVVAARTTPIFVSERAARRVGHPLGTVIGSAVDTFLFAPRDRGEARAALGWPVDGTYVLLPGARANRVKGAPLFDDAVEAARASIPELRTVSLEGYTRSEAALVMNAVNVILMTSLSEGSPVAVKEALASATPVVSVAVGDVPSVLDGLPGCAVVDREPKPLASALILALEAGRPPELRERAEQHARQRVAKRVLDVYATVRQG